MMVFIGILTWLVISLELMEGLLFYLIVGKWNWKIYGLTWLLILFILLNGMIIMDSMMWFELIHTCFRCLILSWLNVNPILIRILIKCVHWSCSWNVKFYFIFVIIIFLIEFWCWLFWLDYTLTMTCSPRFRWLGFNP